MTTKTRRTKGTGSIVKRTDGRWQARIDEGWGISKTTGKRVRLRRAYYTKTKIEAERKLRAELNRIEKGGSATVESLTVGTWLADWLAGRLAIRVGTAHRYEQVVRLHLVPRLGYIRLARLSSADVSRMLRALHEGGMAAVTVSQVRQVLIAALNKAIRDGILVRNVAKDAESPRVEDSVPFAMTPEMARAIAAACGDYSDELRRAVVFGISTGVRWGEQQALRWSDVDLDGGYLVVQHSMTRTYSAEGGNVLSPVKTPRSRRRVELGPSAIDLLKTERANQTEAVGPIPGLVFRDSKGNDRRNDPRHLQTALKRAGLLVRPDTGKPLTWDACCREGHASLLLQQGWNLKAVADRLGNTPAILAKHYAGITQAEQVRIGSSLEALDIG